MFNTEKQVTRTQLSRTHTACHWLSYWNVLDATLPDQLPKGWQAARRTAASLNCVQEEIPCFICHNAFSSHLPGTALLCVFTLFCTHNILKICPRRMQVLRHSRLLGGRRAARMGPSQLQKDRSGRESRRQSVLT